MRNTLFILSLVLVISACGHVTVMRYGMKANPYRDNPSGVLAEGRELFRVNCFRCHGAEGFGDGEALGVPLDQRVADLTDIGSEKSVSTIAGRIAAGKGDDMPAFEGTLTEDQIWKLANYIHSIATIPYGEDPSP